MRTYRVDVMHAVEYTYRVVAPTQRAARVKARAACKRGDGCARIKIVYNAMVTNIERT